MKERYWVSLFLSIKKITQIFEVLIFFCLHNSISYQNKAKPTKITTQSFHIKDNDFPLFDYIIIYL